MTVAESLIEKHMFIDGEWIDADDRTSVVHPYNGEKIGSVPLASTEQLNKAIDAAERAFEETDLTTYERYELLSVAADELNNRAEEVASLITSEQGKPITEARNEVDRAIQTMRFSAEEAKRQFGEYVPMDPQKGFDRSHAFTQDEPLGVVGAITPFNFPLNLMAHKLGPALAAGDAVVGKPATNAPLSSIALYECVETGMEAVDAPEGLANVVTGKGSTVGDALLANDAVEAISFTGSTDVGKYLANNSGMTELTLELGGNDPTIVWEDTDIEEAASRVVGGAYSNAGQVCNSVERVLVHEPIENEFIDAAVDAAESLEVGNPFDEDTDIAAMVDDEQFNTVVDIFEETVAAGATVATGGEYGTGPGGRIFEPTVLTDVTPDMAAAKEETFGPLVPIITVSDFDEAIRKANNTNYGLEAGLFTQNIDHAKRAADEIDAGGVNINTVSGFRTDHMPYGGFKDLGVGKEG